MLIWMVCLTQRTEYGNSMACLHQNIGAPLQFQNKAALSWDGGELHLLGSHCWKLLSFCFASKFSFIIVLLLHLHPSLHIAFLTLFRISWFPFSYSIFRSLLSFFVVFTHLCRFIFTYDFRFILRCYVFLLLFLNSQGS